MFREGNAAQTIFIPEFEAPFTPSEELKWWISQDSLHLGEMVSIIQISFRIPSPEKVTMLK